MEKYDNSSAVHIKAVFPTRYQVDSRKLFWSKAFQAHK